MAFFSERRSEVALNFNLQPILWIHAMQDSTNLHFPQLYRKSRIAERAMKVMNNDLVRIVNLLPVMLDEVLSLH
jgi:hypothetical protein